MSIIKHIFQNTGEQVHNDQVLPGEALELSGNEYNIKVLPRTSFWRFGIRLSKTPHIDFFHPEHRYKTPEFNQYIDIHLGVGEWDNAVWSLPSRIHLAQYNITGKDHLLSVAEYYQESTEIVWMLQRGPDESTITSMFLSKENEPVLSILNIDPAFQYFKVFAWADKTDYKIQMEMLITPKHNRVPPSLPFHLPTFSLTSYEKKYLTILYEALLENKTIDNPLQIEQIWNEQQFPRDFTPGTVNSHLATGTEITLWGIWHIDPSSTLFDLTGKVIQTIKWLLQNTQTRLTNITTPMIVAYCSGITLVETEIVFKLLYKFSDFSRGHGSKGNMIYHIMIKDPKVYEQYRQFTDFQTFMLDYLKNRGVDVSTLEKSRESSNTQTDVIRLSKTQIQRIARNELNPVLGVKDIAQDLAEIILTLHEDKGQMLGIFGMWGRGKSFLIEEVWKKLATNKQPEFIRVDYHAWKYQETPASWAYLYELLVKQYEGDKIGLKVVQHYFRRWKLNFARVGVLPVLIPAFVLLTTFTSWFLSWKYVNLTFTAFIIPTTLLVFIKINKDLEEKYNFKTSELVKKYLSRFSFKDKLGIQAEIQEEVITLLKVWLPKDAYKTKKILLVVEDLDRCTEDKIIQNIDSLRIMLDDAEISKRIIILTAIDERILKNAIRSKYSAFAKSEFHGKDETEKSFPIKINELVSEYLDKLFIAAIKLGSLNIQQTGEFFRELIKNQIISANAISSTERAVTNINSSAPLSGKDNADIQLTQDLKISKNSDSELGMRTIPQESDTKQKDQIQLSDNWEKLTAQEVDFLEESLKEWKAMTPRKIYIFYYRYLLCKNLLIKKYEKENIINGWQDVRNMRLLLSLLISFSKNYNPNIITEEKERIAKVNSDNVSVRQFEKNSQAQSIAKLDYIFLLEVFELAIAY